MHIGQDRREDHSVLEIALTKNDKHLLKSGHPLVYQNVVLSTRDGVRPGRYEAGIGVRTHSDNGTMNVTNDERLYVFLSPHMTQSEYDSLEGTYIPITYRPEGDTDSTRAVRLIDAVETNTPISK